MNQLATMGALLVAAACAAPIPPSPPGTASGIIPTPSTTPTLNATPTAESVRPGVTALIRPSPSLSATPTATPSGPSLSIWGDWSATCVGVAARECRPVAKLFINNLAWSAGRVFEESGGNLTVEPRPLCPDVPEHFDGSFCWQVRASLEDRQICMVIARQDPDIAWRWGFGQVGGDYMATSLLGPPKGRPECN